MKKAPVRTLNAVSDIDSVDAGEINPNPCLTPHTNHIEINFSPQLSTLLWLETIFEGLAPHTPLVDRCGLRRDPRIGTSVRQSETHGEQNIQSSNDVPYDTTPSLQPITGASDRIY